MTRDDIIRMAREAGGRFHGPNIEHLSISEEDFLSKLAPALLAAGAAAEREKFYSLKSQLKTWREAYPLSIFQKPDWEKVRDALEMNGLTLDGVSAANILHAIGLFEEMIDETICARGQA